MALGLGLGLGKDRAASRSVFNSYPALKAAYAAGRGKIGFIGDSKTMGWLARNGTDHVNCYTATAAATVISDLNAAGITAIDGYFGGSKLIPSVAQLLTYDTRITCSNTTNWSFGDSGLDGTILRNSADTVPMTLTPGFSYDRVRAAYLTASQGSFTVKQGGSTILTIDQSPAGGFTSQTASVSLSSTALDVARVSSTAWIMPFIEVWNSTIQHVQVYQMGVSGRTTSAWLANGSPWNPYPALSVMDCDCYLVELGANDKQAGVSAATYKSNLQTLITYLKGLGADVQLVATTRCVGGSPYDIDAAYVTALNELVATNSLPPLIDLWNYSTPYSGSTTVDGVHRTATYNATVGHVLSAALTS